MKEDTLFTPLVLRHVVLKNRIIRSATYEGWSNPDGVPRSALGELYAALGQGGVGAIITGFVYIAPEGRAMQKNQGAMDRDDLIEPWRRIVARAREAAPDLKIFMQLAHTGRQTRREVTKSNLLGASTKKCTYFRQRVTKLTEKEILRIIDHFALAAKRAKEAGFDGVQVHAAHGYLIHQFLSPWTNFGRRDQWKDRPLLLERIILSIKEHCGADFPLLVKLSAMEDVDPGIGLTDTIQTIQRLKPLHIDAWEISYGTMEYALNIIRGALPVDAVFNVNPLFSKIPNWFRPIWKKLFMQHYITKFKLFSEGYNVAFATEIKKQTGETIMVVGGLHSASVMRACLSTHGLDAVCLCRPLICEPDFPEKIRSGIADRSACTRCNLCLIHCDGLEPLRCYVKGGRKHEDRDETF